MDRYDHWEAWANDSEWPEPLDGYTLAIPAIESIGAAMFGDDWIGNELAFSDLALINAPPPVEQVFPPPFCPAWVQRRSMINWSGDDDPAEGVLGINHASSAWFWHGKEPSALNGPPTRRLWREARERWQFFFERSREIAQRKADLCRQVHSLARAGALRFAAQNWGTGQLYAVPLEQWNCSSSIAEARFARARVGMLGSEMMRPIPPDARAWASQCSRMTMWLFVTDESLVAVLRELRGGKPAARERLPMLVPGGYAPSAAPVTKAVSECAGRPAHPAVKPDELREHLRQRVLAGATQTEACEKKSIQPAFPNRRIPLNREGWRKMFNEEHLKIKGVAPKQGPQVA